MSVCYPEGGVLHLRLAECQNNKASASPQGTQKSTP
jgi:hypothetical protein